MSFFNELKRRNVIRVGIAYVVIAWLTMQFADVVLNNIEAPGWVFQAIMLVLAIGFPFVLVFAWAFEMTPEGLKKEKDVDRSQSITPQTGKKLNNTILVLMALAIGYLLFDKFSEKGSEPFSQETAVQTAEAGDEKRDPTPVEAIAQAGNEADPTTSVDNSIAVLPFADLSPEKDQEYFTDGLSEELLNLLAKIPELKVAARTSSFQFKGKSGDVAEIGKQLKVAHILEGSVRKSGNRVRITAQLIKTDDGYHLWSETWDRTLDDVFAIQDEIAGAVVEELKVNLLGEQPTVAEANPEAYSHYLQGRYFFNRGDEDSWRKARTLLETALEIDPVFAPAWSSLSEVLWSLAGYGYIDINEGMLKARKAAERALELDPGLASAWVNLANLLSTVDWDYAAAGEAIRKALDLEPGNSTVQGLAGDYAKYMGRFDESIAHYKKAIELDPMYYSTYNRLSGAYIRIGRLNEAEEAVRKALYLQPDLPNVHGNLSDIHLRRGETEQALVEAEQENEPIWKGFQMIQVLFALGRLEESDQLLQQYIDDNREFWAYQVADLYAFRGETDKAFEWFEIARRQRDPGFSWILSDPLLGDLYQDPRWEPLLESVGLLEAWQEMPASYKGAEQ
jgi:adenylate cyclase